MKYIKPTYKINNGIDEISLIRDYDFKKSFGEIVYRFTVYKYITRPLVFCELIYNKEESQLHVRVIDNNGLDYGYNKEEYGKSSLIELINSKINKKLKELNEKGLIKL